MEANTHLLPRSGVGGGHEPRVSWKDVACGWMVVLAAGLLALIL
jgi:hypothetical protein